MPHLKIKNAFVELLDTCRTGKYVNIYLSPGVVYKTTPGLFQVGYFMPNPFRHTRIDPPPDIRHL